MKPEDCKTTAVSPWGQQYLSPLVFGKGPLGRDLEGLGFCQLP